MVRKKMELTKDDKRLRGAANLVAIYISCKFNRAEWPKNVCFVFYLSFSMGLMGNDVIYACFAFHNILGFSRIIRERKFILKMFKKLRRKRK